MLSLTIAALEERLTRLAELPAAMECASRNAYEVKQQCAVLQKEIDDIRYGYEFEVRTSPEYKNEGMRDAAIKQKMASDERVKTLQKEIASNDEIRSISERQMWQLKDEFSVVKHSIRASVAVIEGLTDPIVKEILCGTRQVESNRGW